ncbi:hypothetical protein [Streptomyces sp. NRRL F-4707]|uniref:hypothetical protein n=1 Tax=Streptomyces sp. NRRL F-4707 TaxID=1519496 RepID=UPI000AE3DB7A|nr:hypothetical protein [Streptomyces sp. NRRL F-4707]
MNGAEFDPSAFRILIPSLSPSLISRFLDHSGWVLTARHEGLAEYWTEPESDQPPALLPLNMDMRDFDRRMAELLAELGRRFEDDAAALLRRIDRINWDVLVIRTGDMNHEDSVSIVHATKLLDVGMEMVRRSALYTLNPNRSSWGKKQSHRVTDYLQKSVRLGHTERGSFIFPILSRVEVRGDDGSAFGRQVMSNLAQALSTVHHWSTGGTWQQSETSLFDIAIAKPLISVAEDPSLHRVNISFRWSPTLSAPPPSSSFSLDFDALTMNAAREAIRELEASQSAASDTRTRVFDDPAPVSRGWVTHTPRHALPATNPPSKQISGHVVSIGVDDRDETPHFIVLRGTHGDVRVLVTEADYDFAMRARAEGQQVTAEGELLDREGRRTLRGSLIRPGRHPAPGRTR